MAPQNSTLIHENTELASDLSRYSPILTIKEDGNDDDDDVHRRRKSISSSEDINILQEDELPIWICGEPRFISGLTSTTTCNDIIQALINDEIHSNNNDVAASRDFKDYVITEKWRDVEQALEGEAHILPLWIAWGTSQTEVKFKLKINKNWDRTKMDGERKKKTHKKHKKSAAVSNLLKRLIEQGETIKDQLAAISDKPHRNSRRKVHLRTQTKSIMDTLPQSNTIRRLEYTNECLTMTKYAGFETINTINEKLAPTDDELFLLIDNKTDENDSGVHVEYRQYLLNKKLNMALEAKKSRKIRIEDTPRRKQEQHQRQGIQALRKNTLNKRILSYMLSENCQMSNSDAYFTKTNEIMPNAFDGIRYEIAIRMTELNELILCEEDLTEQLAVKCEQYRNLNKIYTRNMEVEICIEEIQRNLDSYAKDVIKFEVDLFNIKQEIHQKCGILHNLQRMLNAESDDEDMVLNGLESKITKSKIRKNQKQKLHESYSMSEADGSFGPCDNSANKSFVI